jgi:hypothetical protein
MYVCIYVYIYICICKYEQNHYVWEYKYVYEYISIFICSEKELEYGDIMELRNAEFLEELRGIYVYISVKCICM